MSNAKFCRIMAMLLVLVLSIGMLPVSALAATDAVSIYVADSDGKAVAGATVTYGISDAESNNVASGSSTTDADGRVSVLASEKFAEGMKLSATVKKDKYVDGSVSETITSGTQDFKVTLEKQTVPGVSVTWSEGLTYDGQAHALAEATGTAKGDTIVYKIDGETVEKCEGTNAGDYEVTVTVSRDGYKDFSETKTITIAKAEIGVTIEKLDLQYEKDKDQELVKLNGELQEDDTVTWTVNGTVTSSREIPKASAVRSYEVNLKVDRGANYKPIDITVTSTINQADIALGDTFTIKAVENLTYNGEDQKAITVSNQGDYTLEYNVQNSDVTEVPDGADWTELTETQYPTVKDAGTYNIFVRAVKDANYTTVNCEPYPITVTVRQKEIGLKFTEDNPEEVTNEGAGPYTGLTYDFSAGTSDNTTLPEECNIEYSISVNDGTAEGSIADYAEIDKNAGILTVLNPAKIDVTATVAGNKNYTGTVTGTITVKCVTANDGTLIGFENKVISYKLNGNNRSVVTNNQAKKTNRHDNGKVTYSITPDVGLNINSDGKVTITDYSKLATAIEKAENNVLLVQVTADKSESRFGTYSKDQATYIIKIQFAESPEGAYTLTKLVSKDVTDTDGNVTGTTESQESFTPDSNTWYTEKDNVTVTASNGYSVVSFNETSVKKLGTLVLGDGDKHTVYLMNTDSGEISSHVVNVNVDNTAPSIAKIEYSTDKELGFVQEIVEKVTFGYYNPTVTVTITASDSASGLDYACWAYTLEGASEAQDSGKLTFKGGKAVLTLTADEAKQYRGNLSFYVVDNVGHESEKISDTEGVSRTIIVDTIAPVMESVTYSDHNDVNGTYYYQNEAQVTFEITEANFNADDVNVKVKVNDTVTPEKLQWTRKTITTQTSETESKEETTDTWTATLTLSAEGSYIITVDYTDRCGNAMTKFTSNTIVIDNAAPSGRISDYGKPSNTVEETHYYAAEKAEITVLIDELNFVYENVSVNVTKDGNAYTDFWLWHDEKEDQNPHMLMLELSGEGKYEFTVDYTDPSGNKMEQVKSDTIIIDTTAPTIEISYSPANGTTMDGRTYYNEAQTATVTVTEKNFDPKDFEYSVKMEDAAGSDISKPYTAVWTDGENDTHTTTFVYDADANYTFSITKCTDLARNEAAAYTPDQFTVDTAAPQVESVTYSESKLETVLSNITFGFYNAQMTVTIVATDATSGVHALGYSCVLAEGVSSVNAAILNQAIEETEITRDGVKATMSFTVPKSALGPTNQFNGTVKFSVSDRSGNSTSQDEQKRIVVDNIAPTSTVNYNAAVNTENGVSYYDGPIHGTVSVTEANFYEEDVKVNVSSKDGGARVLNTAWNSPSADSHIGNFSLTEDGSYIVTINYADKSTNAMQDYTSNRLVVDTKIEKPTFTINGEAKEEENGGAYKDRVEVTYSFSDENYDSSTIKLVRTRFNETKDVTSQFINVNTNEKGGTGSFVVKKTTENDGIYVLTIGMKDKAGHTTESYVRFTVNRYGSVYAYSDYLSSIIQDGGSYLSGNGDEAVTDDIVITEYNADRLVKDSLKILITRDGESIDPAIYTASPKASDTTPIGSSGWYEYVYTISKDNFTEDGVYNITIASEDATGNTSTSVPENSVDANGNIILDTITFTVDTTAPEIRNVVGLEKKIVNAQELLVTYTIVDIGGLKQIDVIVNGETVETITDFADDWYNYKGELKLTESKNVQTVRIVVTDLAGNVTDTAAETFDPGDLYVFHDEVTVSTNFFVRWYANTGLFWGSIIGVVAVAAGLWFFVIAKRKKDDEEEK